MSRFAIAAAAALLPLPAFAAAPGQANTPAIIMTGDIRSETVAPIAAEGMSVLLKPFLLDDLLQQIARVSHEPAADSAGAAAPEPR